MPKLVTQSIVYYDQNSFNSVSKYFNSDIVEK